MKTSCLKYINVYMFLWHLNFKDVFCDYANKTFAGLNFKMQSSFNYLVHGGDSLWKSLFKLCPIFDFHQKISSIAKSSAYNFYNLSKPSSILYTRIYCEEIPFLFRIILFPNSKYHICIFKVWSMIYLLILKSGN